jgi:SAM-dependent methyltransferase
MNFDIDAYSTSLVLNSNGIYTSKKNGEVISYPASGSNECFEIEDKSFWFEHRKKVILQMIQKFPPSNNIIFDIGGGNGYMTQAINNAGFDAILVEPYPDGALNAKTRGIKHVINADINSANLKNKSIPSVALFDVIEHIEDDGKLLDTLKQKLIGNGKLYITVPAYQFLWSESDITAGHYRRYTAKGISTLLNRHGFTINKISYFFCYLPLFIFIFRRIPFLFDKKVKRNKRPMTVHKSDMTFSKKIFSKLSQLELKFLNSHNISFGGSIIVVATKN